MATTTAKKAVTTAQPKAAAAKKASTTRTTRSTSKSTPAKATATAKKAQPKAEPKVKKSDLPEDQRDWTYLAEKDPTDLHEDMAAWIEEITGIEADLKTVQAVCVLRMVYQRSDRNKNRSTYRALDEATVAKRSEHMIQAAKEAKEIRDRQKAEAEKKQEAAKAKRAAAKKAPAKKA